MRGAYTPYEGLKSVNLDVYLNRADINKGITEIEIQHLYSKPIICNQIKINACRDDPLLVKSETKVSIKYLACLSARPSVSGESIHYHQLRFTPPSDQVRTQ